MKIYRKIAGILSYINFNNKIKKFVKVQLSNTF